MEAVVPIPAVIPAAPDGQVGVPIAEGEAIVSEQAMASQQSYHTYAKH